MTNDFSAEIVRKLQALYKSDPIARRLFDWIAARQRDASETTIARFAAKLRITRAEAVTLARQLEEAGCGEFIVGRRGSESRFAWAYSRISLGQAAAGESAELEEITNPMAIGEEEDESVGPAINGAVLRKLTIAEAKRLLADSLGVEQTNIEITIKA